MPDPKSSDLPPAAGPAPRTRSALRPLFMVLALIFLWEAWLWEKAKPVVAWVTGLLPFKAIKHAIAQWARRLPPYGALVLFVVPLILIEPINILALWFFAHKDVVAGSLCFLVAKLVGVGLMAFLFEACRQQLRSIGWFARLCDWILAINAWAHRLVDPYKIQLRGMMVRLRARAAAALGLRGGPGGLRRAVLGLRRRVSSRS